MAPTENDKAATDLAEEKNKYGFGPIKKGKDTGENSELNDDESDDMGDLDEDENDEDGKPDDDSKGEEDADDDEDSDDDSEDDDSDEDEDDEEDEEDDSDDGKPNKKKVIPFKAHNKLRKKLGETQKLLEKALSDKADLEAKLPDDFEDRVKALAEEIGIADPENMVKITKLIKDAALGATKKLEEKLSALEQQVQEKNADSVVDEFPAEWESFEKDYFKTEFPNATDEQIKSARKVMEKLAKTKGIGGKAYTDKKTGKEVLDPYPLDYIFYKNKKEFEYVVTGKKKKGMETARTQGIKPERDTDGEVKHLPKNAKGSDIRALDKKYAEMESGSADGLRTPDNNSI